MSDKEIRSNSNWVYLIPIKYLELTKAVNNEFRVDRVTFINVHRLPYVREKFGIPKPISGFYQGITKKFISKFFNESNTYAIVRFYGSPDQNEKKAMQYVREELQILSLSQLGYARRTHNCFPQISEENPSGRSRALIINTNDGSWHQPNHRTGKAQTLSLDEHWKEFHHKLFIFKLISIIQGKIEVHKDWKKELKVAAILAGQSQCTRDVAQAFLWNMITLELLLTQKDDKYSDALPERVESFLGWTDFWKTNGYTERVREIYKKRCALVHRGNRNDIKAEDLLFSDDLLLNLFTNIVAHIGLFRSKNDIIEFSKKVDAEHILGIKPKIQPKTLTFHQPRYNENDFSI